MTATKTFPMLPHASKRAVGDTVYIHGTDRAFIVQPYDQGALVTTAADGFSTEVEWDRLTDEPAPPLRFQIKREEAVNRHADVDVRPQWIATGNRPDWSSEYCWGYFDTVEEAIAFATDPQAWTEHDRARLTVGRNNS